MVLNDTEQNDGPISQHAKAQLEGAGLMNPEDEPYNGLLGEDILALVRLFEAQNHSGFSASVVFALLPRLCMGQDI